MRITIIRTLKTDKQVTGLGFVTDEKGQVLISFYTLEQPWRNNMPRISCIPQGSYKVVKRLSTKFKHHFHILDVTGRSLILIHAGNYNIQTEGCIIVGSFLADINNDGYIVTVNSQNTMDDLNRVINNDISLRIIDNF
jgi:hypothetical protein